MFDERMATFQVLAAFMFVDCEIADSEIAVLKKSLAKIYDSVQFNIDQEIEKIRNTDKKQLIENFVSSLLFLKDYTSEKNRELIIESIIELIKADKIIRESEEVLFSSIRHAWGVDVEKRMK